MRNRKWMRFCSAVLVCSMLSGTVSLASEVPAADSEAPVVQDAADVSDVPAESVTEPQAEAAGYTVRWYDGATEEELGYEVREGIAGEQAVIDPNDLLILGEGFTFRNEDERNVQTGTVLADGSLELKLYFDVDPAVKEPVVEQPDEEVPKDENAGSDAGADSTTEDGKEDNKVPENVESVDDSDTMKPVDIITEENGLVTYTVEWRNSFGMLIMSETRTAQAGEKVAVTDADQNFDTTNRYVFNEEAEGNVLEGEASDDLVLVLYFDDVQAVSSLWDYADVRNEFHFIVDMTSYGGTRKEVIRTDLKPSACFMSLYDKFDWSEADRLFNYEFDYYWSSWGDSPAGATTPGYGTFYSRNKTDQKNAEWYFGWEKAERLFRDPHWGVNFKEGSVVAKSGFCVDAVIIGDNSQSFSGKNVAVEPDKNKKFVLHDYLPSKLNSVLSDPFYDYTFENYRLSSGDGVIENVSDEMLATLDPSDFCKVEAVYSSVATSALQVDVKIVGDMNETFDGILTSVNDDSVIISDYCNNSVFDIMSDARYSFTLDGIQVISGQCEISDDMSIDSFCSNVQGHTHLLVTYICESASNFRVDAHINVYTDYDVDDGFSGYVDTKVVEGSNVSCIGDGSEKYSLISYLSPDVFLYLSRSSVIESNLTGNSVYFEGFEIINGTGLLNVSSETNKVYNYQYPDYANYLGKLSDTYVPVANEDAVIVANFSIKAPRFSSYYGTGRFINTAKIYGDVPIDTYTFANECITSAYIRNLGNHTNSRLLELFKNQFDYNDYKWTLENISVLSYGYINASQDNGWGKLHPYDLSEFHKYESQYASFELASLSDSSYDCIPRSTGSNSDYSANGYYLSTQRTYRLSAISNFKLDTRIYGDKEELIEGTNFHYDSGGFPVYNLNTYVDSKCLRGYDKDYDYVFRGYVIKTGNGLLSDSDVVDSTYKVSAGDNHIVAMYEAIASDSYANVQVKAHMTGLVNQDVDLGETLISIDESVDLNDYLINLDTNILPNFDLTWYSAPSFSIYDGDGMLNDSVYSGMSAGSTSVLYINYEVSERDWESDIMYLIFEDGHGNKLFDALTTRDGNITVPVGYYLDGHQKQFSHKAWKDKVTGEDICLPSISSAKKLKITKTTTVVPRLEYYMDNLNITSNVKVVYENGLEEIVDGLSSNCIVDHESSAGTRNVKLQSLLLNDRLNSDYYRYDFVNWQQSDVSLVDTTNRIALQNENSMTDSFLDWIVSSYSTTGKDCSFVNLIQNYKAICVANDFKVNTVVQGEIDVTKDGSEEHALLTDAVPLKSYVDQSAFEDDRFVYTFSNYEIVSGSGQLTAAKSESSSLYVGNYNNGLCEINAIYVATKKPTLTYDTKGGSAVDPTYPEDGRFMVTRRTPSKEGFVFKGWSASEEALDVDYIGGDSLSGSKDRVLYAVWAEDDGSGSGPVDPGNPGQPTVPTAKTYTLSYDTKTDMTIADQKSNTGSFTVTRRVPNKDGFVFAGWSLSEDPADASEVDYFAGDVFPATNNVTLHAVYVLKTEAESYVITYDTKGGSEVHETKAENGVLMVTRHTPAKKGYVFAGWSLESEAKDIDYVAGDKLGATSNVKLYAVWVKDAVAEKYVLSYDTCGGTEVANTESIDGKFMVTRRTPKKDGKVFLGWSFYPDDDDIDFIAGDFVLADKNVTLYAVYTDAVDAPVVETHTITYDTRGGSAVAETKSYNGMFTITRRQPELKDKVFVGWTLDPDSTNPADVDYVGGDSFAAESDLTLYALYKSADVVVNTNGGSDVTTEVTVVENKYVINITIPVKPGYDFPGWDTDGDGVPDVDPEDPIETEDPNQPIDAVWQLKVTPAQYVTTSDSVWLSDVVWDTSDTVDADTVRGIDDALIDEDGRAMVKIPVSTPVRTGYVFLGWDLGNPMLALSDEANYYQAGDAVYMDELDSLYEMGLRFTAMWEPEAKDPDDGKDDDNKDDSKDPVDPGKDDEKDPGEDPGKEPDKNPDDKDDGDNSSDVSGDPTNPPKGDDDQDKDEKPGTPGVPNQPSNLSGGQPGTGFVPTGVTNITNHTVNGGFHNSGMVLTGGSKFVNKTGFRRTGGGSGITPVKTGDPSDAAGFGLLLLLSMAVMVYVLEQKKREQFSR